MLNLDNITQFLNLYLVLIDVIFLYLISGYIWRACKFKLPGRNLGLGLAIYVTGHGILRAWTWFWKTFDIPNHYITQEHMNAIIYSIGLLITILGLTIILKEIAGTINKWLWWGLVVLATIISSIVSYLI